MQMDIFNLTRQRGKLDYVYGKHVRVYGSFTIKTN